MSVCEHPDLSPSYGYKRGCRCVRCHGWHSRVERARRADKAAWDHAHPRPNTGAFERIHAQADVRRRRIAEMWADEYSLEEIAADLETTRSVVGNTMTRMRQSGWELPYRRLPRAAA